MTPGADAGGGIDAGPRLGLGGNSRRMHPHHAPRTGSRDHDPGAGPAARLGESLGGTSTRPARDARSASA